MKKRFVLIILFLLCLLFIFNSDSFASGENIKNYFSKASYEPLNIKTLSGNLYSVIKLVGMIIAVCMVTYMAIAYMLATPQKRAQLKERLVFLTIGVMFLVAGVAFLDWYEGFAKDVGYTIEHGRAPLSAEGRQTLSNPQGDFGNRVPGSGGRPTM